MSSAAPPSIASATEKTCIKPLGPNSHFVPIRPRPLLPKSAESSTNSRAKPCLKPSLSGTSIFKPEQRKARKSCSKDRKPILKKRAKSANPEGSASNGPMTIAPASLIAKRRKSPSGVPGAELATLLSSSAPPTSPRFFKDESSSRDTVLPHSIPALRASKRNANVMLSSGISSNLSLIADTDSNGLSGASKLLWGESASSSDKEDLSIEDIDRSPIIGSLSLVEELPVMGALSLIGDNDGTTMANDDLTDNLFSLERYLTPEIDDNKPLIYDSLDL